MERKFLVLDFILKTEFSSTLISLDLGFRLHAWIILLNKSPLLLQNFTRFFPNSPFSRKGVSQGNNLLDLRKKPNLGKLRKMLKTSLPYQILVFIYRLVTFHKGFRTS